MNIDSVRDEFKARVCDQVDIQPEGNRRFVVSTPFRYEDGDHFVIILRPENEGWVLTDEASTLMHLSYDLDEDVTDGNRGEILANSLATFSVENREGELVIPVENGRFGDALFSFVQALAKVTDISFLSRERVASTFMEDFKAFLRSRVPQDRLRFDWYDERHDPAGKYPVDARINGMKRPLFVYGLQGDAKVRDATISLLTFEKWHIPFRSMAVFENQATVARTALARFTDVCDKAYSSLEDNRDRIAAYLEEILKPGG